MRVGVGGGGEDATVGKDVRVAVGRGVFVGAAVGMRVRVRVSVGRGVCVFVGGAMTGAAVGGSVRVGKGCGGAEVAGCAGEYWVGVGVALGVEVSDATTVAVVAADGVTVNSRVGAGASDGVSALWLHAAPFINRLRNKTCARSSAPDAIAVGEAAVSGVVATRQSRISSAAAR